MGWAGLTPLGLVQRGDTFMKALWRSPKKNVSLGPSATRRFANVPIRLSNAQSWCSKGLAEVRKLKPTILGEFDGERAALVAEYEFVARSAIGRETGKGCVNRSERLGLPYDWNATVLIGTGLRPVPALLVAGIAVRDVARAKKATPKGQVDGALACHGVSVHGQG